MSFAFYLAAIFLLKPGSVSAITIQCNLTGSIDSQYEASLASYRFFLSTFKNADDETKRKPLKVALKEILSGNHAAIFALFYAHIFDICNLVRIQEWAEENSRNLTAMKVLQDVVLAMSNKVAVHLTQLEKNLTSLESSMAQDLRQITEHLSSLKNQCAQMEDLIYKVLQLRFVTMSLFALSAPVFYVVMFALMFVSTNVDYRTLLQLFTAALLCEMSLTLVSRYLGSIWSGIFRFLLCSVIYIWLWRTRHVQVPAVSAEEILDAALY